MSFKVKNASDNNILHENSMSAEDFNTPVMDSDWMHIDHPLGDIKMKQWLFDGVRMGYSECLFKKPASLEWQGDMDVITMYFNLKGSVSIGSADHPPFVLGNNQQNMFYGNEASGFMKMDELRIRSFMVQFNKDAFLQIASGGTDALKYFSDAVACNKTVSFSNQSLPVDINTQESINAIINCRFSDELKRVFFLSKAMELMVLQADAQMRSVSKRTTHVRSDYDRDRIVFARDHMMQHIDMPPTIAELAKIAGINEFKLKKGYKEIFGNTIFGHLAEARLERSRIALLEGNQTISAIAFELGYSSVQHFSTAFRKRFGISPKQAQLKKL